MRREVVKVAQTVKQGRPEVRKAPVGGSTDQAAGKAEAPKLDSGAVLLICGLVLAAFVPAAYLGGEVVKAIARSSGGPVTGLVVVGIGGIVLAALGAGAYAVATKWRRALPVIAGGGAVALAGLSLWMLIALEEARESVLVFLISVVVLVVAIVFIKAFGSTST